MMTDWGDALRVCVDLELPMSCSHLASIMVACPREYKE